jgi:Amt family ammonium transporter
MDFAQGLTNAGDTAWVLVSAALVLLMTPGVAFFYGGMLRRTNALGIIMQSFCALGVVSVGWAVLGFSVAFSSGNGWFGDLRFAGLTVASTGDIVPGLPDLAVPTLAFVLYQMMGAVITPALVTGATAERWRFGSYLAFLVLWPLLVYAPVAHWVFAPNGWANRLGVLDFAGGIVVHANAGAAAIAMALLLGRRIGWPGRQEPPHSLPLVMVGTGLLWFGWLGYNGGSALAAGGLAAAAATNTHLGGATALLTWIAVERIRSGKSTVLGAGCGAVAGLVAVTPAAGYVAPSSAILIGGAAGVVCCLAVGLKSRFGLDDSLDVVAVHLVGGALGTVCVGLFATRGVNAKGADGLFYGGGPRLLGVQVLALVVVVMYSLGATLLIGWLTGRLFGNRVSARQERVGLDLSQHGEVAYGPGTPAAPTSPLPDPGTGSVVAWPAPAVFHSHAGNGGEAVALRRRLAEADPADYLPDLASSLHSLGVQLAEVGRHAEAVAAVEEAVALRRRLAEADPADHLPDLASSLNHLGRQLSELGRREESLAATEEAVAAYRRLAQISPNAFLPEFATALNGLSTRLAQLGHHEEGLTAIDEAVTVVYRRLAHSDPDAFLPDLATALDKQSTHLDELGRREEGLAAIEEAVAVYRRLAHSDPDAFLPDLATVLSKQSMHLDQLGGRAEGLAAIEEVVAVYRRLAQTRPDTFLPHLAAALNNLSIHLDGLGRHDEGLGAIEEAVSVYRRLAHANPATFLPELAASLVNLGRLRPQPSEDEQPQRNEPPAEPVPASWGGWRYSYGTRPAANPTDQG